MAKNRSIIRLKGTLGGITFVDSKAYGAHNRLPRGTHKPAPVNEVLQANAARSKAVTGFGKSLLPLLKAEGGTFYQRGLWQALLKRLFSAVGADTASLVDSLPGLELHGGHPLAGLVNPLPAMETQVNKGRLAGTLSFPPFLISSGTKGLKAIRFGVVVLWTDGVQWEADPAAEAWVSVTHSKGTVLSFEAAAPRWATHYAMLLKGEGGDGKTIEGSFSSMGLRIVNSGAVKKGIRVSRKPVEQRRRKGKCRPPKTKPGEGKDECVLKR